MPDKIFSEEVSSRIFLDLFLFCKIGKRYRLFDCSSSLGCFQNCLPTYFSFSLSFSLSMTSNSPPPMIDVGDDTDITPPTSPANTPTANTALGSAQLSDEAKLPDPTTARVGQAIQFYSLDELKKLARNIVKERVEFHTGALSTEEVNAQSPTFVPTPCWGVKARSTNCGVKYTGEGLRPQVKLDKPKGLLTTKRGDNDYHHVLAAHVMMWYFKHTFVAAGDEISHLCHNTVCINPNHLITESVAANKSRNGCAGYGLCRCRNSNPHAPHMVSMCKHTPRCMVEYRGLESLQLPVGMIPTNQDDKRKKRKTEGVSKGDDEE